MTKKEKLASADICPPRRGRPRTFDRDKALGQATLLFWLKGYEGTSIVDLTDAIGIEAPSLYAAFGSKKDLFAEALRYYGETYQRLVWDNFFAAATAREAAEAYLVDSAAALTGSVMDVPRGCMATLSALGDDAHPELGGLVRSARAIALTAWKAGSPSPLRQESLRTPSTFRAWHASFKPFRAGCRFWPAMGRSVASWRSSLGQR